MTRRHLSLLLIPLWPVLIPVLAGQMLISGFDNCARHIAWRYLRTRRAAWLALIAVTLTVWVPVAVMGVMQGWLEVWRHQIRAAEADLTISAPRYLYGLPQGYGAQRLADIPGVAAIAPYISSEAVVALHGRGQAGDQRHDSRDNVFVKAEGLDFDADLALGRMDPALLHVSPTLDLKLPPLDPAQRGTGFLTPRWRSWLLLRGMAMADPLGFVEMAPQPSPRPGVIVGRELVFLHGGVGGPLGPGALIHANLPDAAGGRVGHFLAEVSDTIGTGVYEIDRYTLYAPLPQMQRLTRMDGSHPASQGQPEMSGWRVRVARGHDPETVRHAIRDALPGLEVRHWTELRSHLLRTVVQNRNILGFVMICVQLICVFIIYAVFTTLVAEKRHDIGVLLGLGARRKTIVATFLGIAVALCLIGGICGWILGWTTLALLNPVSFWLGVPLFPQEFMYTPEAPVSFNPLIPLTYVAVITVIGLFAAFLPAWQAGRIDPIDTIREHG